MAKSAVSRKSIKASVRAVEPRRRRRRARAVGEMGPPCPLCQQQTRDVGICPCGRTFWECAPCDEAFHRKEVA